MKIVVMLLLSTAGFLAFGQVPSPATVDINCDDIKNQLEQIYEIDQGNRGKERIIDEEVDIQNQSQVVAIITSDAPQWEWRQLRIT